MAGCLLCLGGCVGHGTWGAQAHWPGVVELGRAAVDAASDPETWVPIAAAAAIAIAGVDEDWSEDLAEDQPIFGSDAADLSTDLQNIATAAYFVTALAAPSATFGDKAKGLGVGISTFVLDGVINQGLKDLTKRERPDGSNDQSMPSGHASKAASRTALAINNLDYIEMPGWSRSLAAWSLRGVAIGSGLARVEAEKHHLSDVLVGYAMGHFIAGFMQRAFLEQRSAAAISFVSVPEGGALRLSVPLN